MGSVLYASVGGLVPAFIAAILVDLVKTSLSRRRRHSHRSVSSDGSDSRPLRDSQESGAQCRERFVLEVKQPVLLPRYSIDGLYLGSGAGTMVLFPITDDQLLAECLGDAAILLHRLPTAESMSAGSVIRPTSMWLAQHRGSTCL